MKKLLTLVLCWLIAFTAMAETTLKAKTALSAAGGYITSLNKVDGSFEDGTAGWIASTDTIVQTASTEFQGNYKGVWSGTGAGTLDLQWIATASNTYEASAQVNVNGEDDVYVCAYVGTTETGCKLIPALNKIQKVSVVADSVISSAFYLRLKHTGSDAFAIGVDDGKIEPWTPQAVNLVKTESAIYYGNSGQALTAGTTDIQYSTLDSSTLSDLGTWSGTAYTAKTNQQFSWKTFLKLTSINSIQLALFKNGINTNIYSQLQAVAAHFDFSGSIKVNAGDVLSFRIVGSNATSENQSWHRLLITATAISDNVVQSWQPSGSLGELKFLPQNVAPQGFIPALGSSIGKTAGTYQGDAYYDLYKVLWTQSSVTAGEPYVISSAKGTDAATDWAANKTITIDVSGLVVRAYKSGITGEVGAKQLDAFQGHVHLINHGTDGGAGNVWVAGTGGSGRSGAVNRGILTPYTDGTNGTPRTASETRMTNIAQYAFIRYGNDAPTLLALPTSKENRFEAVIANNGTASISSQNVDWINSVSRTAPGQVTINYAKLGLTAIPSITLGSLSGIVRINSISTTQAVIYTSNPASSDIDVGFHIKLSKQFPDYTAPGVFVGNVQPEWQYDLTVTGTNWTTTRAVGVVYKMASGQYRLKFNIHGSVSAGTRPSYAISLTGVTFKNIANFFQSVSGNTRSSTTNYVSECTPNSGTITAYHANISVTEYMFSGDVELESKPTWATQTP